MIKKIKKGGKSVKILKTHQGSVLFFGPQTRSEEKLKNIVRLEFQDRSGKKFDSLKNIEWIKGYEKVNYFLKKEAQLEYSNLLIIDFDGDTDNYEIRKVTEEDLRLWIVDE